MTFRSEDNTGDVTLVSPTLLIDGDIIVYRFGFSADKNGSSWDEVCLAIDNFMDDLLSMFSSTSFSVFLSDSENFRNEVAVTANYKGNRSQSKPGFYREIKEYLKEDWGAMVCQGQEADDCLGINQTPETVICSIDKDLDQIPGWHFNWQNYSFYHVTRDQGLLFFYKQMLTGDAVDNIKGLYRVGPKTADKWLDGLTPAQAKEVVTEKYKKYLPDNWEARLKENAQLLWIRRK